MSSTTLVPNPVYDETATDSETEEFLPYATDRYLSSELSTPMVIPQIINAQLRGFLVGFNSFDPESHRDLCRVLKDNTTLLELRIRDAQLNDTFCNVITELQKHPKLQILAITHSQGLEPPIIEALAELLTHNRTLTELDLEANGISDIKRLAEALKRPKGSLRKLNLRSNQLQQKDGQALLNALRVNETLQRCSVVGNAISIKTIQRIRGYCSGNQP
jgi:Ran GTPase-activating protein (RanGAP) involved in mRNA processing and transport